MPLVANLFDYDIYCPRLSRIACIKTDASFHQKHHCSKNEFPSFLIGLKVNELHVRDLLLDHLLNAVHLVSETLHDIRPILKKEIYIRNSKGNPNRKWKYFKEYLLNRRRIVLTLLNMLDDGRIEVLLGDSRAVKLDVGLEGDGVDTELNSLPNK